MKVHGRIILIFCFYFFLNLSFAANYSNTYLVQAFKHFRSGSYSLALNDLKNVRGDQKILGTRFYLEGIILNRLQRFDESLSAFNKAIKYGNTSKDLYYEFGQALYANSELIAARKAFKKSYDLKFKVSSSLYYVAHISQLLEEHKVARDSYILLLKTAKDDPKLRQIAKFQLSESFLALAENRDDPARLVEKYVIPSLTAAIQILPKAPLVEDIERRKTELERRYQLDPNLMKNGKVLSKERFSARIRHEFRYDSNITLATDVPTAATLEKDTFIHETNLNMQYLLSAANQFTFTPFFRIRNTYHSDRETSTVYQNDTYNITTGSNNTYEHKLFNQQSALLFNFDYVYIGRDAQAKKERPFFSRAVNFTLGERFRFFSFGPTTVKIAYKDYRAYTNTLFNKTKSISIDQIKSTATGSLFIFLMRADFIDQYNNQTSSTDNYLFRIDWLKPEILPSYTLNLALSTSFLDTKLQKATRGIEKNITPTIEMRKNVNSHLSASMGYDFTRNISKNKASFDYKKHVVRFELSASY